jgi:hypothetical protein
MFMLNFNGLAVQSNKGHGVVIDCGAVTSRTNKGLPGGILIKHLRAFNNVGHCLVAGLGNGNSNSSSSFADVIAASSLGVYRLTIIDGDLDCASTVLDGTGLYGFNSGFNSIIKGESVNLQNVAFGCLQNGSATLTGAWLSGWTHKHSSCRYIQSVGAVKVKATPGFDAYDFKFENAYLDTAVTVAVVGEATSGKVCDTVSWSGSKKDITFISSNFNNTFIEDDIRSGTYTPTLTNTTNLDASAAFVTQYMRVGSVVTVSGKVNMDPTATGNTILGMSLPFSSDISGAEQVAGVLHGLGTTEPGVVYGDATNKRATLQHNAIGTGLRSFYFHFTYRIR